MSLEEAIAVGVLVNTFVIQLPWFIIWLLDRKKDC